MTVSRNWHKMRSKGMKAGMLIIYFQSNGHKASVGYLIRFIERNKLLPSLVNKEKLIKDIASEKERERGRASNYIHVDKRYHHSR